MPKNHEQELNTEAKSSVSVYGEGIKAGLSKTKGWFQRIFTATNVLQAGGTTADVSSSMKRKRFGNWYSEKVVDSVASAVIHECEEPLDVHLEHGSNKPSQKNNRSEQ
jgi:hypothetical protein